MVAFMKRLLGYSITGSTREHIMPVFCGKGRNGKGTLIKALQYVMGRLSGSIQSEMLLQARIQRSSAGPSPDILDLRGLRMAFAAETDEGQRFSAAKVKWLTGADQLIARGINEKKQVRFDPTHTIFLNTNFKPRVIGDDYAFWKRMVLIYFRLSYVSGKEPEELEEWERIADPDLELELKAEASGILAWLVQGCLDYQKHGLKTPQSVIEDTHEYQQDEDDLGQFLDEYCRIQRGVKTPSTEIYVVFDKWWKKIITGRKDKGISQKAFGRMMKRRFDSSKKRGVIHYHEIELNPDRVFEFEGED
jgi:putative DNA primase/helicase